MELREALLKLDRYYTYENTTYQYALSYSNYEWLLQTFNSNGNTLYANENESLKELLKGFYRTDITSDLKELADINGAVFEIEVDEANGHKGVLKLVDGWGDTVSESEININGMETLIEFLESSECETWLSMEAYGEATDPMGTYGLSVSDFI